MYTVDFIYPRLECNKSILVDKDNLTKVIPSDVVRLTEWKNFMSVTVVLDRVTINVTKESENKMKCQNCGAEITKGKLCQRCSDDSKPVPLSSQKKDRNKLFK